MQVSVHIFKTNINTLEQIKKWNIDLEDCDKVLKIESSQLETCDIIGSLKPFNIYCEVLE